MALAEAVVDVGGDFSRLRRTAEREVEGAFRRINVDREGERVGRGFGSGVEKGVQPSIGTFGQLEFSLAKVGAGFGGLLGAVVPVGPALAGVAAAAVAVVGAVGQASGVALSAAGVFASFGVAMAAVQVGSLGVSEAFEAQSKAQEELAQTGAISAATQEELDQALKGLAPSARALVKEVATLGPAWSDFQNSVQQQLFAGLAGQLRNISDAVLPSLTTNLTNTAGILNDAAQAVGRFIAEGGGAEQFDSIMAGLNETLQAILPAIGNIGQGLLTIFAGSTDSATSLASAITSVTEGFAGWAEGIVQSGQLADFLANAQAVAGDLIGIVVNLGSILISVFGAGADEGASLLASFRAATGGLASFLQTAAANSGLQQFFGLIQQVGNTLGILGPIAAPIFQALTTLIAALLPHIQNLRTALQPVVTAIAVNLNTAMQGLAPVISVVIGLVVGIVRALAPLVTTLVNALGPALNRIGNLFMQHVAPAIQNLVSALGPVAKALNKTFGPILTNIIDTAVDVLDGLFQVIGGLIDFIVGVFTGDWKRAWNGIKNVFGGVVNAVRGLLRGLFEHFRLIFTSIGRAVSTAWNALVRNTRTAIQNVVRTARLIFSNLPTILRVMALRAAVGLARGLLNAVSRVRSIGATIVNTIRNILGRIDLFAAGRNILSSLASGMISGLSAVARQAANAASTIRDYFPFSPAKVGPMSGSGSPDHSGEAIMNMLAEGILGNTTALNTALTSALSPLDARNVGSPVSAIPRRPATTVAPRTVSDSDAPRQTRPAGVTVNQQFFGPTTNGGRLSEVQWALRFAATADQRTGREAAFAS